MPGVKHSWFGNGRLGFHLTINPLPSAPISAGLRTSFLNHGMRLSGAELSSLMKGRAAGINTLNRVLKRHSPALGPSLRMRISAELADALLSRNVDAQLSLEAPTALQQFHQSEDQISHMFERRARVSTLRSLSDYVGASLTIHFDGL